MNFALNRYKTILLRKVFLLGLFALVGFASLSNSLYASTEEQQRREARVQATYLIHLINFTRWSEAHSPEGKAPEILVLGDETNGLVASLRYLIAESKVKIGGSRANFLHFTNGKVNRPEGSWNRVLKLSCFYRMLCLLQARLENFAQCCIVWLWSGLRYESGG